MAIMICFEYLMYWSVFSSQYLMQKRENCQILTQIVEIWTLRIHFHSHIVLQIQDEVIVSDAERLRITQSNVKMVFLFSMHSQINSNVLSHCTLLTYLSNCLMVFAAPKTFSSWYSSLDSKNETERTNSSATSFKSRDNCCCVWD